MGVKKSTMESVGLGKLMVNLNFYKDKRVFVTGHTGFKGSWLCHILKNAGADVTGYSLAPNTNPDIFSIIDVPNEMRSVIGDIRDYDFLKRTFNDARPEIVFHLAAQPIVRTSYQDPLYTYQTNVMGTVNLLECIRTADWQIRSVLNVTTDKVYENVERDVGYREDEKLDGYDPYSNSKSCSELVTHSYTKSFLNNKGISVSTARAGNVLGGGDYSKDRIIPDCVRAVEKKEPVLIRNKYSVRPYQHVLEPLMAYLMIAEKQYDNSEYASSYNVGPDDIDCVSTGEIVDLFCKHWGDNFSWIDKSEKNAPHEAGLLKLNCTKLKQIFGWNPKWKIDTAVNKTVEWYKAYEKCENVVKVMNRQIEEYLNE